MNYMEGSECHNILVEYQIPLQILKLHLDTYQASKYSRICFMRSPKFSIVKPEKIILVLSSSASVRHAALINLSSCFKSFQEYLLLIYIQYRFYIQYRSEYFLFAVLYTQYLSNIVLRIAKNANILVHSKILIFALFIDENSVKLRVETNNLNMKLLHDIRTVKSRFRE